MRKKILTILSLFALLTTAGQAREVSIETKIQGLYIGYFNRAGDQEGLNHWKSRAAAATNSSTVLKELSAGFATHPTFSATYAHLSNKPFIEAIYRNVLGKEGDSGGINFWSSSLDQGANRSDVVSSFIEASLEGDLTQLDLSAEDLAIAQQRQDLITNKASVANRFTSLLGNLSNPINISHPEDEPAYLASEKILTCISENESTASARIDYLSIVLSSAADPIGAINDLPNSCEGIFTLSTNEISTYLNAINQARRVIQDCHSRGVFPAVASLTWSEKLYQSAYEHSYDLATSNTFSHNGSGTSSDLTGVALGNKQSTFIERIDNYNYRWSGVGENIAAGTNTNTASIVVQQWLDSDGHCANMMNASFTQVGMAMVRDTSSTYTHYWTQNFGTPRG
ncbi:MAG: DUF4214 domain-containing protein [Cocleimonas sp.]|nr:DUF4214 domain-containing protein [Cocleimonas sp.]